MDVVADRPVLRLYEQAEADAGAESEPLTDEELDTASQYFR